MKSYQTISPDWVATGITVLFLPALVWCFGLRDGIIWRASIAIAMLVDLLAVLRNARGFRCSKESLTFTMFTIPYRAIRWDQIIQMGLGSDRKGAQLVIVTLSGCRKFDPQTDRVESYPGKGQSGAFPIPYSQRNVKILEEYYGPMDYDVRPGQQKSK